tara:strand:+ start:450 stop:788 length:339 start_codon:yes stop_codon:yes gene_type:complete
MPGRISRRNANTKKIPTVPKQPVKSNNSVMGNVAGGMASGFGVGTGIEAARGLGGAIFGSNQTNTEAVTKVNENDQGCQILSEMITKCKEKNDGFNDCNDLLQMFSDKCLSK